MTDQRRQAQDQRKAANRLEKRAALETGRSKRIAIKLTGCRKRRVPHERAIAQALV